VNARVDARSAAQALRGGGIIAYPTEAVWGLGCDPRDVAATLRLVDGGRTSAVVRLDGTTVRVDAIDGGRWQATLPPAAAERLRATAERLGR
jgi:L-threonylcarbamoyladenylate synthase